MDSESVEMRNLLHWVDKKLCFQTCQICKLRCGRITCKKKFSTWNLITGIDSTIHLNVLLSLACIFYGPWCQCIWLPTGIRVISWTCLDSCLYLFFFTGSWCCERIESMSAYLDWCGPCLIMTFKDNYLRAPPPTSPFLLNLLFQAPFCTWASGSISRYP